MNLQLKHVAQRKKPYPLVDGEMIEDSLFEAFFDESWINFLVAVATNPRCYLQVGDHVLSKVFILTIYKFAKQLLVYKAIQKWQGLVLDRHYELALLDEP